MCVCACVRLTVSCAFTCTYYGTHGGKNRHTPPPHLCFTNHQQPTTNRPSPRRLPPPPPPSSPPSPSRPRSSSSGRPRRWRRRRPRPSSLPTNRGRRRRCVVVVVVYWIEFIFYLYVCERDGMEKKIFNFVRTTDQPTQTTPPTTAQAPLARPAPDRARPHGGRWSRWGCGGRGGVGIVDGQVRTQGYVCVWSWVGL